MGGMTKQAILHRMVMPGHTCPYGLKAKHLLKRRGFAVDDRWLTTREAVDAFKTEHQVATTPQTVIDGERIGGYDDLRRHFGLKVRDPEATSYVPVIAVFATTALSMGAALAQDKVVYHFDNTVAQGLKGLRNVRNHLDTDPSAKITVVTHANGVDFLMEGAKDANGGAFAGPVAALVARGVSFEICEITLKNRDLKKEQFIQEADYTPSGVVRIAQLQKQGAAYIKP